MSYNTNGQSIILHVGMSAMLPSAAGNLAQSSYQRTTSPYTIANGKVVTTLSETPFEVTVYKIGDTFYGARSNEFGYANYEVIPQVKELNPLGTSDIPLCVELS